MSNSTDMLGVCIILTLTAWAAGMVWVFFHIGA